jgi:adenosylmethionine-8-amino-7-oxononanoate aminotransferase
VEQASKYDLVINLKTAKEHMLTSAKALSAAMQPISTALINERIHEAMLAVEHEDRSDNRINSHSASGNR